MWRIILAIIIGFIIWIAIFAGVEPLIDKIAPSLTVEKGTTYTESVIVLMQYLIRSIIASIVAGLIASLISAENIKAPLILGIALFAVTTAINISGWNTLPVWYHLCLLGLIIPMTILGGKLKKRNAN